MSSARSSMSLMFCSTSTIDSPLCLQLARWCGHHLGDDLRRQALRRLVHQQHARIAHQRAADRQHLLLAARQMRRRSGRGAPAAAGTCANTVSTVHGACLPPSSGLRAATIRFSRTVRLLKMRRPCGTSATPRAAIVSGGRPVDRRRRTPRPRRGAAAAGPSVTFMQVDLPAPLRPSSPSRRASPSANDTSCSTWLSP